MIRIKSIREVGQGSEKEKDEGKKGREHTDKEYRVKQLGK